MADPIDPALAAEPAEAAASEPQPQWRGRSQAHWWIVLAGLAALAVLVGLRYLVTPAASGVGTHEQLGLPPCRMVQWFDLPCPGCGVTTSVAMAVQGDPVGALANQPFGVVTTLLLAALVVVAGLGHLTGRDLGRDAQRLNTRRWLVAGSVALAGSWIYKILLMTGVL